MERVRATRGAGDMGDFLLSAMCEAPRVSAHRSIAPVFHAGARWVRTGLADRNRPGCASAASDSRLRSNHSSATTAPVLRWRPASVRYEVDALWHYPRGH